MSELKVNSIKGVAASTAAITVNNTDGTCTANLKSIGGGQLAGFRNLVINGNMKIHQRAQSVTGISAGYATADRFYLRRNVSSTFNSNVTNGVLTCNSPSSSTGFDIRHGIEWDDIFYGKTMTVSFNATAAVGGVDLSVEVVDGSVASTTAYEAAHLTGTTTDMVDLAVTPVSGTKYEVTVDIPADGDVSFTPDMLRLRFGNAVSDASQSFALSNVQFEFGTVATDFEYRSFGQELALCQRYYYQPIPTGTASVLPSILNMSMYNSSTAYGHIQMPVEMRTNPTLAQETGTDYFRIFGNNSYTAVTSFTLNRAYKTGCELACTADRGQGNSCWVRVNADAAKLAFGAEL